MKKKKQYILKCLECEKKIIGFSEQHVKMNLEIHRKTSQKHKDIVNLLRRRELNKEQ